MPRRLPAETVSGYRPVIHAAVLAQPDICVAVTIRGEAAIGIDIALIIDLTEE